MGKKSKYLKAAIRRDKPVEPKLSADEHRAIHTARKLGLYVLFQGPTASRKWTVYSTATGRVVLTYFPRTQLVYGFDAPLRADWGKVLRLATAAIESKAG